MTEQGWSGYILGTRCDEIGIQIFIQPKNMNVEQIFKQFTTVCIDQDVSCKSDEMRASFVTGIVCVREAGGSPPIVRANLEIASPEITGREACGARELAPAAGVE